MVTIRCIEGILLEGVSDRGASIRIPIMKGEEFELIDPDNMEFEGVEYRSVNPGMAVCLNYEQLANNFEFVGVRTNDIKFVY